jgi:CheY-like chemotaxis protein
MRKRILVVDDDEFTRMNLLSILQRNQYDVSIAENGVEGLQMAIEVKPDIIVTDIMMPQKNGITLLNDLRTNPELKEIPIIMLSAVKNYLERALKEINDPAAIEIMKFFFENIGSPSDRFLYRFRTYRRILFTEIDKQISIYKKGYSFSAYRVFPDIFIDKPFDVADFIDAVQTLIKTSNSHYK